MKRIILIALLAGFAFSAMAQKVAHVNLTELILLTPDAEKVRTQMEASQKEAEETFNAMTEELRSKFQVYEQKVATWTPSIKAAKEKELQDLQQRLQQFQQNYQQEAAMQEESLFQPIRKKVGEVIEKLAKEAGVVYVFDVTNIVYFDKANSTDLTPKAKAALKIPATRTLEALQKELQMKAQGQAAAMGKTKR